MNIKLGKKSSKNPQIWSNLNPRVSFSQSHQILCCWSVINYKLGAPQCPQPSSDQMIRICKENTYILSHPLHPAEHPYSLRVLGHRVAPRKKPYTPSAIQVESSGCRWPWPHILMKAVRENQGIVSHPWHINFAWKTIIFATVVKNCGKGATRNSSHRVEDWKWPNTFDPGHGLR